WLGIYAPEKKKKREEERNKDDLIGSQHRRGYNRGNQCFDDQFYDAQVEEEEPSDRDTKKAPQIAPHSSSPHRKIKNLAVSRTLGPTSRSRLSRKFRAAQRKRANRFHDESRRPAENAKLQPYSPKPKQNPIHKFPHV
ncbi:hypothetical protein Dimus_015444, partial [Dionaea muscipula]